MFKDFSPKIFSQQQKMRGKDQKQFITQIQQNYPALKDVFEEYNKKQCLLLKAPNRIQFISIDSVLMFFNYYDGQWLPMLRLLHKYPDILPYVQIDKGACKFVLQGAQLMAPGVSDAPSTLEINKVHPFRYAQDVEAMGYLKLLQTPEEIMREGRKNVAGEILFSIGDGLWEMGDQIK